MGLILALDQGSTKTVALVSDRAGQVLGTGYARGASHPSTGMETAMAAVQSAAAAALNAAGATPAQVDIVSGGLSGADYPYQYELLRCALKQVTGVPDPIVVNDCIIAWRAGNSAPWGAVLCVGTGTNAAVISPDGKSFVFGDYIQGDDHGGSSLGRLALRAVFDAEAGVGPATGLTELLLARFGLPTVDELLCEYVHGRLGRTSELMDVVVAAVRSGDAVAVQLVSDFGQRLARYVVAGLRRFGLTGLAPEVVLSGGIFKAELAPLRASVSAAILRDVPQARIVDARYEPVAGALLLALDRLGVRAGAAFAESAAAHRLLRL
jgi:N-acetylglucosamine kinase-like BadF-type ATPase